MKLKMSNNPIYLGAIAVACAGIATTAKISANLNSERSELARQKALRTTAQHVLADTCWQLAGNEPLRIGDRIDIGSMTARSPTACFKGSGQYGFAAYINSQLQITQVFSAREIQAAKSLLLEPKK